MKEDKAFRILLVSTLLSLGLLLVVSLYTMPEFAPISIMFSPATPEADPVSPNTAVPTTAPAAPAEVKTHDVEESPVEPETPAETAAPAENQDKKEPPAKAQTKEEAQQESSKASFPMNINLAGKDDLMAVDGIGEVKATAILNYLADTGGISKMESLLEVKGIGEKTLAKIEELFYAK